MNEPPSYEEEPEDLFEQQEPPEEDIDGVEATPEPLDTWGGFSSAAPTAAPSRGGCRDCSSLTFDQRWSEAFGVHLCHQCRQQYSLISKVRQLNMLRNSNSYWSHRSTNAI